VKFLKFIEIYTDKPCTGLSQIQQTQVSESVSSKKVCLHRCRCMLPQASSYSRPHPILREKASSVVSHSWSVM